MSAPSPPTSNRSPIRGTRGLGPPHLRESVVTPPLVGVDRRPGPARLPHHLPQRRAVGVLGDGQPDLAALTPDHTAYRRSVIVPRAMAGDLVRPPTRRVVGIGVRHAFFPPRSGTPRRPPGPRHPAAS